MKKIFGICFFVLMTGCILTHSSLSLAYAALGLNLWYEKMVPVLLPFMILSGTLIRMGMTDSLIRPVKPLFGRIFRLPGPGIYVILVGFLCGFPMGARTIADLRNRQELSSEEGQYLLAFCNNLGPVYFLGFVLPLLHRKLLFPYVFGMYGVPFVIACTKIGFRRKQTNLLEEIMLRSFWNRPVRLPFLPYLCRMPWMMPLQQQEEASYSWEAT